MKFPSRFRLVVLLCVLLASSKFATAFHSDAWFGLANVGVALLSWNGLSYAAAVTVVSSPKEGRKIRSPKKKQAFTKQQYQVIDNLLRSAEIAKLKKKEQEETKEKNASRELLDPLKCFPKALCGVSAEVENISKKKKDGLITEYLILMKAVNKHPEFLQTVLSNSTQTLVLKNDSGEGANSDEESQADVGSNERGEDSEQEEEEEGEEEGEDEIDYYSEEEDDVEEEEEDEYRSPEVKEDSNKKRTKNKGSKKHNPVPKNDDEFTKAYLKEKLEMEKLMKETVAKEQFDREKYMWDLKNVPASLRPAQDQSQGDYPPPQRPWRFGLGGGSGSGGGGGLSSLFRWDDTPSNDAPAFDDEFSVSNIGSSAFQSISNVIKNLLWGFGVSSLTNDPWYPAAARKISGEIARDDTMGNTREMLETALDIGKTFEKPSQCNDIFSACEYEYTELLYMIDDLRRYVRDSLKNKAVQDEEKNFKKKGGKGKKRKNGKEGKSDRYSSPTKTRKRIVPSKASSSISEEEEEESGEYPGEPEERYVIPVTTPTPSTLADTFSSALSWLGLSRSE